MIRAERIEFLRAKLGDAVAVCIERSRPRCRRDIEARMLRIVHKQTLPRSYKRAAMLRVVRSDIDAVFRYAERT